MHLEDVDFRNLSAGEAIDKIKALNKPGLKPLIRWIAQGYIFPLASQQVRVVIADGEREVERHVNARPNEQR